jgi:hypothetical protein
LVLSDGPQPTSTWQSASEPLTRGRLFHVHVQTAFLAGLLGADAAPERPVTLSRTRSGRVDLLVLPSGGDLAAVVVEIKSTDWDALAEHRVRPNLRSHVRQLQRYLDVYIGDLRQESGPADLGLDADDGRPANRQWDSVSGVLLYPQRPTNSARVHLMEEITYREALTVVWYDEVDWKDESDHLPRR